MKYWPQFASGLKIGTGRFRQAKKFSRILTSSCCRADNLFADYTEIIENCYINLFLFIQSVGKMIKVECEIHILHQAAVRFS